MARANMMKTIAQKVIINVQNPAYDQSQILTNQDHFSPADLAQHFHMLTDQKPSNRVFFVRIWSS